MTLRRGSSRADLELLGTEQRGNGVAQDFATRAFDCNQERRRGRGNGGTDWNNIVVTVVGEKAMGFGMGLPGTGKRVPAGEAATGPLIIIKARFTLRVQGCNGLYTYGTLFSSN